MAERTERDVKKAVVPVEASSLAEGITALAASVLAILGLIGIFPVAMLAITTIVVGLALFLKGGAVAARFTHILEVSGEKGKLSTGFTAESIGGLVGIVLGILALLGIFPIILISSSAIIYGGTLMLSSAENYRLNSIHLGAAEDSFVQQMSRQIAYGATDIQVLIGLGAIVLGILALVNVAPLILTLVAMLSIGVILTLSGMAMMGRMATFFSR